MNLKLIFTKLNRLFSVFIDFLIEIDRDKNYNNYSVPLGYILQALDLKGISDDFLDILNDTGLEIDSDKDNIAMLKNVLEKSNLIHFKDYDKENNNNDKENNNTEKNNNNNKNNNETYYKEKSVFQTAYEIIENKDVSEDSNLNDKKDSKPNFHMNSSNRNNFIVFPVDLEQGLVRIQSMATFIEKAAMYVDLEKIARILTWKRFELFISEVLHTLGFSVITNFRFSVGKKSKIESFMVSKTTKKIQKRFEIDVVAIRDNKILFIDAKYYKPNKDHSATFAAAGEPQKDRAHIFSLDSGAVIKCFQLFGANIEDKGLSEIKNKRKKQHVQKNQMDSDKFTIEGKIESKKRTPSIIPHNYWVYPIILHSGVSERKLNYSGVPIVSFMNLSDFLMNFEVNKNNFIQFRIKNLELQDKLGH